MHILIADDESIIRLGLKAMLTDLGHRISMATDGREALRQIRSAPPDLAILDIEMPFTDGLAAAQTIARLHPLPVIILTAYGQQDLIERASDLPIHGYLLKPVNERGLAAAIAVAAKRFEEQQALARRAAELEQTLKERKLIDRAKALLMQQGMSEQAAHQTIQRRARTERRTMGQIAEAILKSAR